MTLQQVLNKVRVLFVYLQSSFSLTVVSKHNKSAMTVSSNKFRQSKGVCFDPLKIYFRV